MAMTAMTVTTVTTVTTATTVITVTTVRTTRTVAEEAAAVRRRNVVVSSALLRARLVEQLEACHLWELEFSQVCFLFNLIAQVRV